MLKDIFKAYDIRGVYGEDFDEKIAYKIGRAVVEYIGKPKFVVGRDMRESSNPLFDALTKGITEQGGDVIDIGLCSTPMFYFAVNFLKADAGVMVTASHNPAKYNGFKFVREQAIPCSYNEGIGQVEVAVISNDFQEPARKGMITKQDIIHDFANFILGKAKTIPKLKVIADTSNGMAGLTVPVVFENLDMDLTLINKELDGNFPNHEANPLKLEAYKQLIDKVKKEKADMGVMFDGDADRVGFVDEKGNMISSDLITALLSKKFGPKEKIIYDVRSSWTTQEEIRKVGNEPIVYRVGHSFIKAKMREVDAVFAGELSGHYYFKDMFFVENSIFAMLMVAQIIEEEGKPFSEIMKPLQRYFASGEINSDVDDKISKMNDIKQKYSDGKLSEVDGISIEYDDWWFNVRPSNTEPLLRLNLEAKEEHLMKEKVKELLKIIRS